MRVLVTGGTGHLGRAVVQLLRQDGHNVRVLTRKPSTAAGVERVRGDLATGEGVAQAVAGAQLLIHAATNSPAARRGRFRAADFVRSPSDVDLDGTQALLSAAEQASVEHFIHVSIVGLEHMARLPYSRVKLEAEELVRASAVPWSIVRATGFYWLMERMLSELVKRPLLMLPSQVRMQSVDSDDFARYIVACVSDGKRVERPDFVGPEVLSMCEMAEQYMAARDVHRRIWNAPMPRRVQAALTEGNTSNSDLHGATTWAAWLAQTAEAPAGRTLAA